MSNVVYINNTGHDIRLLKPHIESYALNGIVHPDIADILSLKCLILGDKKNIIIDWK